MTLPFPLNWIFRILCFAILIFVLHVVNQSVFVRLNPYHQFVLLNAGIAVVLAVSLNLINGITGQFSLGHAGFMAIGAYVSAYFTKEIGGQLLDPINFIFGITLGALAAGLAGWLVGLPSLRLRGDYLAIVTLGFNQIIISVIENLTIVGDSRGYGDIPKFSDFVWTAALVIVCIVSIRNLASSQMGRSMRAIRDDEVAAEASGIDTTRIKILAFVFSAAWAGVAGAMQAHLFQVINPDDFNFQKSVEIVISVVLGGLGSITGSALAAVGLKILEEVLRDVPGVFWTSLGLIALASYWNFLRARGERKLDLRGILTTFRAPALALLILVGLYCWPSAWNYLSANKGSLRYILYSLILIVLMLLRPQGLLGRKEWSFAALRGRLTSKPALESSL